MAYTTPPTFVVGAVLTAAQMNILGDDILLTLAALATTKGDLLAATGANATARLAAGANFRSLIADSSKGSGLDYAGSTLTLDADVTEAEVVNTTTETTVYTFTVPANRLGTTRALRLSLIADTLANDGGTPSITVRVKFGGTVIGVYTEALSSTANRFAWRIEALIAMANATNAQRSLVTYLRGSGAVASAGNPPASYTSIPAHAVQVNNGLAIDTTAAVELIVTVEWSAANANNSFRLFTAHLEVLNP